jgi:hypothetical protein
MAYFFLKDAHDNHGRLEVQGATSQLNLTKEIQDLFQKWQAARAE